MIGSAETVVAKAGRAVSLQAEADSTAVALPPGFELFTADFARIGPDLRITPTEGESLLVHGYFTRAVPPDLVTAGNGVLSGEAVQLLAGAGPGARLAQAGAAGPAPIPVGQVEKVAGSVRVQRLDGTVERLDVGTKIYARDVVITDADGRVSLTFADGTIFSMSESARMVIDELVYSPAGAGNSAAFNLINGGFVFIAGQVAGTGDMTVRTPAATMGIRGTSVSARIERVEEVTRVTVALNRDPDGHVGRIELFDLDNRLITTITATDTRWIISPAEDQVLELPRTVGDDADEAQLIADALAAYQAAQQRVQAGQTYVETGDGGSPGFGVRPDTGFPEPAPEQDSPARPEDQPPGPQPDRGHDEGRLDIDHLREPMRTAQAVDVVVSGPEDAGENAPIAGRIEIDPRTILAGSFALDTPPGNGTATVRPDGSFTYVPAPDFFGTDGFTYRVTGADGTPVSGRVTVNVEAVNDPPTAAPDRFAGSEDATISGNLLANDSDVEGDPLTVSLATSPAHGRLEIGPDGRFTYAPDPDFHGDDSFVYTIDDGNGGVAAAVVTITVAAVNDAPTAGDDKVTTDEDRPVTFAVTGNDGDVDGDALAVVALGQPAHGSAAIAPDGRLSYTPDPDFHGTDSFAYTVSDGRGGTASAQVTVTVAPVNDPPVLDPGRLTARENGPAVSLDLARLGHDVDEDDDGTTLTYAVTGPPAAGLATIRGTVLTFEPGADFDGLAEGDSRNVTIRVTATDRHGATAVNDITVTVTGTNAAPAPRPDFAVTAQGTTVTVDVIANDSDGDGDALSLVSVGTPAHGSATLDGGRITYTPDPGFFGIDSIGYSVADGHGGRAQATLNVLVEQDITTLPPGTPVSITFDPDSPGDPPGAFRIDVTPAQSTPVNLVFAMDGSGSITSAGWSEMKAAIAGALDALHAEFAGTNTPISVSFIAYSNSASTTGPFDLVSDFAAMNEALAELPFLGGATNWEAAFKTAAGLFAAQGAESANILYFITDGNPSPPGQDWQGALADLTSGGNAVIEAFAIGTNVNLANLDLVDSDGAATTVTDAGTLQAAFAGSSLLDAQLVAFSLELTVDGTDRGVIADETSPALQSSGLDYTIALQDIPGIESMLGALNIFAATATFDLDGNPATRGDQVALFAGGVIEQAPAASDSAAMMPTADMTGADAPGAESAAALALPSADMLPVLPAGTGWQVSEGAGTGPATPPAGLSLGDLLAPGAGAARGTLLPGGTPTGGGATAADGMGALGGVDPGPGIGLLGTGLLDSAGMDESTATIPTS